MTIKSYKSLGFMLGFGVFPGIRTIDVYLPFFYLVIRWGKKVSKEDR